MVEEVKYIKFGEVPEAPQIAVPARLYSRPNKRISQIRLRRTAVC